jgi:hypothetical protein
VSLTDDEDINRLIDFEERRHKTEMQRLRERYAYRLGWRRYREDQEAARQNQLRELDAKEARP